MSSFSSISTQISQEEFNLFHSIDRRLFSILIFTLGKDPNDAAQVMALWLWLERVNFKSTIITTIISLPYSTIDVLFMESMLCIHVAMYGPSPNGQIPILIALLNEMKIVISLAYFHFENTKVLQDISKIVDNVCFRAFKDIVDQMNSQRSGLRVGHVSGDGSSGSRHGLDLGPLTDAKSSNNDDVNDFGTEVLNEIEEEVYGKMGLMNIVNGTKKEEEDKESRGRGSNNKTLFLTFSKGYHVLKIEVKEFFQRTFGDVIEGIYMQEVGMDEQPLYARVVVRDVAMMELVLQGQQKVKFSINGKHVCIRKYIRRRSGSPSTPPTRD